MTWLTRGERGNMGQSIKLQDNTYWDMTSIRNVVNVREAGTNLNYYVTNGCWYFDSNVTPVNIPIGTNGWLQVIAEQPINEGRNSGYIKQIWYRSGTPNENDFQIFIRTVNVGVTDWGSWRRLMVEDDIFYLSGETYKNSAIVYSGGHITGGNVSICTNLNVPKRLDKISSISVTGYDLTVRTTAGSYILNRATSGFTVSCVKADGCNVQITITSPTALSATNNTPVSVAIYGLQLKFN